MLAATAFTIFGSCRLADVDPIEYLADVLPKLTRTVRLSKILDNQHAPRLRRRLAPPSGSPRRY